MSKLKIERATVELEIWFFQNPEPYLLVNDISTMLTLTSIYYLNLFEWEQNEYLTLNNFLLWLLFLNFHIDYASGIFNGPS